MSIELLNREVERHSELSELERMLRDPLKYRPSAVFLKARRERSEQRKKEGRFAGFLESLALEMNPMAGGASFFNLVLDTTAPAGVTMVLNGNATYATTRDVTATIATSDTPTTGYEMKLWGNVDLAYNASIQATEGTSAWIAYNTSQAVRLSTTDGVKTVSIKIRDDVWNESGAVADSITLDTTVPVANIVTGPDTTKVSQVAGKRVVTFGWQSDTAYNAYKIKVVPTSGSAENTGTQIGVANGSTNMSGGAGPATTTVTSTIDGRDLAAASAGDGTKVIKIFVQDLAGNWSTA